jgi:hypothetical protein
MVRVGGVAVNHNGQIVSAMGRTGGVAVNYNGHMLVQW